jgi:hypothetical protein
MDWRGAVFMVRPERVELSTFSLGMKCSIHLSYGRTGPLSQIFRCYRFSKRWVAFDRAKSSEVARRRLVAFLFTIPYVLVAPRPIVLSRNKGTDGRS